VSLGIILTDIDYPSAQLDEPVDLFRHRAVGHQIKMESILTHLGLGHFMKYNGKALPTGSLTKYSSGLRSRASHKRTPAQKSAWRRGSAQAITTMNTFSVIAASHEVTRSVFGVPMAVVSFRQLLERNGLAGHQERVAGP
jgi:hypothetical protein